MKFDIMYNVDSKKSPDVNFNIYIFVVEKWKKSILHKWSQSTTNVQERAHVKYVCRPTKSM